jgi:uncharacterized protein YbbC (DUF1343 family)
MKKNSKHLVLLCTILFIANLLLIMIPSCIIASSNSNNRTKRRNITAATRIEPGINGDLSILNGHGIGLITNPSGVTFNFTATIDLLFSEKERFHLVALFSPEHGLRGDQPPGQHISSYMDPITGLPVYSLYGDHLAPTPDQVKNISMLVFDLQDVGTRCYTFMSTLAYCLKAASNYSIPFVVVDRLNPIGASDRDVKGPVLDLQYKSFIGIWNIALQHGMTMGELALMFNTEMGINHPKLHILKIQGDYSQRLPLDSYESTAWLPPSPNLPTLESSFLYPGMVLFESMRNVSLGRGTATPFQILGAPFMDPYKLLHHIYHNLTVANPQLKSYLNGVVLVPAFWIPTTDVHSGVQCAGVRILVLERSQIDSIALSLLLMRAMLDLYPDTMLKFNEANFNIRMGYNAYSEMMAKIPIQDMIHKWKSDLNKFHERRRRYLLY